MDLFSIYPVGMEALRIVFSGSRQKIPHLLSRSIFQNTFAWSFRYLKQFLSLKKYVQFLYKYYYIVKGIREQQA